MTPQEEARALDEAEAREALDHPRPLQMFADSCRSMGLGGNLVLATTVYLAATTRILGKGKRLQAHTYILGPASSGKSFEMEAALAHLPESSVVTFEGCSPKALIYSNRDIKHAVLVYAEMDGLPTGNGDEDASNAALSYLRTLVVNGTATYDVVVKLKGGSGFTTQRYIKEGPATLMVTGTKRIPDEQLASRLHEVEVTVDRERLGSVIAAQGRMLQGGRLGSASTSIVAMQAYLQSLAPIEVVIPFADALGKAILKSARVIDPRLTREFPRIAGFTAAHALLCIQRREKAGDGSIVATLEDYEAARSVVRELSTIREFSRSAIQTWEVVNAIFERTKKAVTVGDVSKSMLKTHDHVRRNMKVLLQGGALIDQRDGRGKTTPHLVTPSAESPCRIDLPSSAELAACHVPPGEVASKLDQVHTNQGRSFDAEEVRSDIEASALKGKGLLPLGGSSAGGNCTIDPAIYRHDGADYRAGDVMPNGKTLLSVDDGIPTFAKTLEVRL